MSTLFAILAGLSFLGVWVGLIAPRFVRMSRKRAVAVFLSGAFVFFILYCVTAPPEAQTLVTAAPLDATSTPQGQIEEIANNAAPGMTNDSNEYHMRYAAAVPDPAGGWDVAVSLNGDDNVTQNYVRQGAIRQISDEFIALYTATTSVSKVSIEVSFQVTDKYGNATDTLMYRATLDKATASKVNWSADKTMLESQILPGVWQTDFDLFNL